MARITVWLLAAVVTASLVNAAYVPEQGINTMGTSASMNKASISAIDSQQGSRLLSLPTELTIDIINRLSLPDVNEFRATARRSDAQVYDLFFDIRSRLGLPNVQGSPTFVGLRTLLDFSLSHLGLMAFMFLDYFDPQTDFSTRMGFELYFPDIFQKYSFRGLAIPEFVEPWLSGTFADIRTQDQILHENDHLVSWSDVHNLFAVIEALFEVVSSPDLLAHFRTIAEQASQEQYTNPGTDSIDPTSEPTGPAQLQNLKAFVYRFWVEVIGGGNIDQLRYFLSNALAMQIIPYMLADMLLSDMSSNALELAQRVSQLPGFIQVVNAYPANAPDYFEFILIFATNWSPEGYESLLRDAQRAGNVDVTRLYLCLTMQGPNDAWDEFAEIFPLQLPVDIEAWYLANGPKCAQLSNRLDRFHMIP